MYRVRTASVSEVSRPEVEVIEARDLLVLEGLVPDGGPRAESAFRSQTRRRRDRCCRCRAVLCETGSSISSAIGPWFGASLRCSRNQAYRCLSDSGQHGRGLPGLRARRRSVALASRTAQAESSNPGLAAAGSAVIPTRQPLSSTRASRGWWRRKSRHLRRFGRSSAAGRAPEAGKRREADAVAGQGFAPQPARTRQWSTAMPGARLLLNSSCSSI